VVALVAVLIAGIIVLLYCTRERRKVAVLARRLSTIVLRKATALRNTIRGTQAKQLDATDEDEDGADSAIRASRRERQVIADFFRDPSVPEAVRKSRAAHLRDIERAR